MPKTRHVLPTYTEKVPSCIRMHDSPYKNAQHGGCPIWRPRVAKGDTGKAQGEMVSCRTGIICRTVANVDGEGTAQLSSTLRWTSPVQLRSTQRDVHGVRKSLKTDCVDSAV